jgi:hypothetical protein
MFAGLPIEGKIVARNEMKNPGRFVAEPCLNNLRKTTSV